MASIQSLYGRPQAAVYAFQRLMKVMRVLKLSGFRESSLQGEALYKQYVWWTPEWYEEKKKTEIEEQEYVLRQSRLRSAMARHSSKKEA